jgi:putative transposase
MEVHLMSEMMSGVDHAEGLRPVSGLDGLDGPDERLVEQLVGLARVGGLKLAGEGGVLQQLTKRLLESTLEGRSATTSATTSMIRPVVGRVTRATVSVPRPY